jgi:Fic family protein
VSKSCPFIDGNKRTGLAAAYAYMHKNNYKIVLPFSAVRFSVLIAQDKKDINEITKWIRSLSAKNDKTYDNKFFKYLVKPAAELLNMYQTGSKEKADGILAEPQKTAFAVAGGCFLSSS